MCITIAANIAKTAILGFDACFPDSIVGFIPNSKATVEYVQQWLDSIQGRLEAIAPQGAQKNINLEILRQLRVPMPPPSMQQDFSIKVAKIRVIADKQNGAVTEFEALFSSLLARAFSGELTAAWRERRGEQLAAEVAQRDRLLAERGAARTQTISPPSIPGTSHVFAPTIAMRGPRDAVLDCLSEEQRQIWRAMQEHDSYLNAEAISQSYDLPLARARQTLELLASAGLLLPVALWNSEISDFVAAYRRLRPATGDEEQSGDEAYADDVALLEAQ